MSGMTGGDKLQAYFREIDRNLATAGANPQVRVGFLETAKYPDGTYVAMVAAAQEFGTRHIPPRPYFRAMIRQDGAAWGKQMGKVMTAVKFNAKLTLTRMGELIVGQLRQSILDTNSPPLSPRTIAAKSRGTVKKIPGVLGPEKPLVDSGVMFRSTDYEVST